MMGKPGELETFDYNSLLWCLQTGYNKAFIDLMNEKKLRSWKDFKRLFKNSIEFKLIENLNRKLPFLTQVSLFSILEPSKYLDTLGVRSDSKKRSKYLDTKLNQTDMIYWITNMTKPKLLIKYFIEKLLVITK